MEILSLCGSIRNPSSNHALLEALRSALPSAQWQDFPIRDLPFFDPELQFSPDLPPEVKELREAAKRASYLVIATPEYAHGIPGILKNALEWLVCEETMQKPVVILVASPSGGEYVTKYLTETLRTMDLHPSPELTFVTRHARKLLDSEGAAFDDEFHQAFQKIAGQMQKGAT